ncbi:MAG TPA: potassium transporter TrkG [Acidimicrobiia bacterium]|nr:potassium transporter TrkG [Acidimicrobiia bacterium]
MLVRPSSDDLRTIAFSLGTIFHIAGVAGVVPLLWAAFGREWAPLSSFALMIGVFLIGGSLLQRHPPASKTLEWSHGMVVVAVTWITVPLIGSIPLAMSGHFGDLLDAYFDAMSGLTTTGLSLLQDLDHLAPSLNFWRHLLHFLGGQGIIIAALSLFAGGAGLTLYYGEARDEKILPSVTSTARFIWGVALVHLVFGVAALALTAWLGLGFTPGRSLFHGLMIFFAGFDTGGFAPQSTSLGYYHSALFEAVTAVLMVAGAMSFGLHFALWRAPGRRRRGEPARRSTLWSLETRSIVATFGITLVLTFIGLAALGIHDSVLGMARQGVFHVLSAHTGTGFATIGSAELATWGGLAFGGMAIAMALGGMASSTAGGVKALRVGLTVRTVRDQMREVLLPERALMSRSYRQGGRRRELTPKVSQAVMTVSLLYVALFLLGAGVGLAYGYPLEAALFESVSAGANVGLSVGLTDPSMPVLLQVVYLLQMWLGRLEFAAAFVLVGFLWAWWRGR